MRWSSSWLAVLHLGLAHVALLGWGLDDVTWCTVSDMEHLKCTEFAEAVRASRTFSLQLKCKRAAFKDQCMNFLDNGQVHLVELDPGEVYSAGRFHSVIPILAERYGPGREAGYYSVAVVHAKTEYKSLLDLKNKSVCFTSVGDMAGWVIPMATLVHENVLEVSDCNNLVKSASTFFGPSCAPNSLIDKHNPTGDNPQKMCELCGGRPGERCSGNDPYAGYQGAVRCLAERGDVAFVKHTTLDEVLRGRSHAFRLLCPSGDTAATDQFRSCNWGFVPPNVVVTTSDTRLAVREQYQDFLRRAVSTFGKPPVGYESPWFHPNQTSGSQNPDWNWSNQSVWSGGQPTSPPWWQSSTTERPLFVNATELSRFYLFANGPRYGNATNLLLQDLTTEFVPLHGNQQTFTGYLGKDVELFHKLRKCPVHPAKLCVVSDKEMEKCHRMKTAFKSQMLKPDLNCIKSESHLQCMHMIRNGVADLVVLEAGDIYRAGQSLGLIPIIAEQYNLDEPYYYVVAVTFQGDKETDLLTLKGRRSCHTGINQAAGWVVPLSFLISNERMRAYTCDSPRSASEFFSKSCVPGSLSREFVSSERSYKNLCDLCHGMGSNFCGRNAAEPFYGHTGAFRCLVEGGGNIAFVKHTTVFENTAGRNSMWWARNISPGDFELVCRDGSRRSQDKYAECNLGKVASNAIVTSPGKPQHVIDAYIDLFVYAQQFYGSKYSQDFTFKMFVSESAYRDLIFQDSAQQLKPVPLARRNYRDYLGSDFLQAVRLVDCSAAGSLAARLSLTVALVWVARLLA
ncbi:ovotransferrin [Ixodes scapularis]|uniref:Putative transferrin n=1 Tax=Ixodes scapularis TaxID=6945 RepID=A0A4D5RI31_IXOSC|nr:ovotransferrin [Ixodes scapularis]